MRVDGHTPVSSRLHIGGVSFGDVAMAAFVLCAATGMLLVPVYDAADGRNSIATWLLTNPGAVFLRNAHYWTAQAFLLGTVLHAWDHLRPRQWKLPPGVWLRVVLSIPVIAFLMLSGFLLRGDADAQQARRILEEVITQLPLVGQFSAAFLLGKGEQLHVIYVHHAATATVIVGLVIAEHVRRIWPRAVSLLVTCAATAGVSLVISAGLHDGLDAATKGPWYFLGLQELLHWTPAVLPVFAASAVILALVWSFPRLAGRWPVRVRRGVAVALVGYGLLCAVGQFHRAENWSWRATWPDSSGDLQVHPVVPAFASKTDRPVATLPHALGRPEGCLVCHAGVTGLGAAHAPESIGCASCHAGDVFTLDAERAHAGMVRVPGNLADAPQTCGRTGCHESIIPRVERSIMATFAGVIAVDRKAFGEPSRDSAKPPHVGDLGQSAADTHVRQLCASCHLGQEKTTAGPVTESSRGGGCNACHLVYGDEAARQLAAYEKLPPRLRTQPPTAHPSLTIRTDGGHCFGCHSRSGRISTSFEGWHELHEPPAHPDLVGTPSSPPQHRMLEDERVFTRMPADVHHERGLQCTDCHVANEIMGKGAVVTRKHDQVTLRCEDCHTTEFRTVASSGLDAETGKLLRLHGWTLADDERLATTAAGDPLVNVAVDSEGRGTLRLKGKDKTMPVRAPFSACGRDKGHERLSCATCHTAWAPRCVSCHTSFDSKTEAFDHVAQDFMAGAWGETSGPFDAAPPTLGVRLDASGGRIDTFVPGMIMTLDRSRGAAGGKDVVFRRWYALTAAHTTRREARSCVSCHNDPVALGYGRGALRFERHGSTGEWRFIPEHELAPQDGLPADAWVGFLGARDGDVSSREDVRPFTANEQKRVLAVGACLTCHSGTSRVMQEALSDFDGVESRRTDECTTAAWPHGR